MQVGNEVFCVQCKRQPVVMTALCRRCYTKKINRQVLDRLEAEFKPLTVNNKFIFEKYLESLRERFVSDADVALARKFSLYLSLYEIRPLTSWTIVLLVAKTVGLHYVRSPTRGCPILQVARRLESQGLIAPLAEEKVLERSQKFKLLPETPVQSWVREYFAHTTTTQSAHCGLMVITTIKRWTDFLGDNKSLTEAVEADAKEFIAVLLAKRSLGQVSPLIRHMRVFYDWLMIKSYGGSRSNPFKNLKLPKLRRRCLKCKKQRSFQHRGEICSHCSSSAKYLKGLEVFEVASGTLPEYRRSLFGLFLKHVRRYQVNIYHWKEAEVFLKFLQSPVEVIQIKSWSAVQEMSLSFTIFARPLSRLKRGCPFLKIGAILQELGVLPIKEDFYDLAIDKRFEGLTQSTLSAFTEYAALMRKNRRNEKTISLVIYQLKGFYDWLLIRDIDFWSASEKMARDYLVSLHDPTIKVKQPLDRFYRWAKEERYTLKNPFVNIVVGKPKHSLKVCSPEQVAKVEKFIRSPKSDPEAAMMLALIFYFGLKIKEMTYATLEFTGENHGGMKIIFHRAELSYGSSRYTRDQVLTLPIESAWFLSLQKRFRIQWQEKFKKIRADLPRQPLILDPRGWHNRPLITLTVRNIYYKNIIAATGVRVLPNVLRCSGADRLSQQGGTGTLQRIGWSKAYAFNFTWMPRQFFRP